MKYKKIIFLITVVILVAADLFYLRFHAYFQKQVANEALATISQPVSPAITKNATPETLPPPRTLLEGQFIPIDTIHKGSGTAKIIEQDGKRYLRFENFQVTNGPDLYVYLSESKAPSNDIKSLDKYISLGLLKGNVGNQNYETPESFRVVMTSS